MRLNAVAVAAARMETVRRLSAALDAARDEAPEFPQATIALQGWMEQQLTNHSAVEIEDRYRALLKENRVRDAAAGRTLDGPHLSDLAVTHVAKNIPADEASTGEQKALLIRLVLAHAGLIKQMTGFAPLLLLDEVVAHLDPARRAALYSALSSLGAQVWITGADPASFGDIIGRTNVKLFVVRGGAVEAA
jgi:DNA replication and repair protein RecF